MTMAEVARGRVRVETGQKRVRAFLDGALVADTLQPTLVWEKPYYPTYYLPLADVRADLDPTGKVEHSPSRGDGQVYDVRLGESTAAGAARRYLDSPLDALHDLVRLDFDALDWFEEDEQIFVHPRDPYTRIDVLSSSRHLRAEVDGVTIAESRQPRLLFETGLPTRYYLPITDLRMDLLRPSDTQTHCPYKGTAEYWSIQIGDTLHRDLLWFYRTPLPESQKIAGLVAVYNERVDLYVDGVLQDRPGTR
jgi:uncharacterized protein (DUF427 family)